MAVEEKKQTSEVTEQQPETEVSLPLLCFAIAFGWHTICALIGANFSYSHCHSVVS